MNRKEWRYKYASNAQFETAWSQRAIREAYQHDLGFVSPFVFTYPCEVGFTFFIRERATGRRRFLTAGVCHWTVRGTL